MLIGTLATIIYQKINTMTLRVLKVVGGDNAGDIDYLDLIRDQQDCQVRRLP